MKTSHGLFPVFILCLCCSAQAFSLSLHGAYGNRGDRDYRYQLNQIGDSAVCTVQGNERLLGRAEFAGLKKTIIGHVIRLTEEIYGSPKDSADFNGVISITAFDRTTVIRFNAGLVAGTLQDTSMIVLLRLLMMQVEDTLRLPQFNGNRSFNKPAVSVKKKRF
jgi:hypothetical protein